MWQTCYSSEQVVVSDLPRFATPQMFPLYLNTLSYRGYSYVTFRLTLARIVLYN